MADEEMEDFEVDTSRRRPGLPPYDMEDHLLPLERRGTGGCCLWALLVVAMNSLVLLLNFFLMVSILAVVLLPTIVVVFFGFQCHSRVLHSSASYCQALLDDSSSSALIILGFVLMSPLMVLGMVAYCRLARRLRLFMCFQPCARATYKGVKWPWCEEGRGWSSQLKAWV
ncbi:transmembrane protein 88B [Anolis carolinensis]|uniref:transmembrane protein 88B n=1 Tax=Anolis carolinensis TaxID=28377 RepID=UPI002F2B6F8B